MRNQGLVVAALGSCFAGAAQADIVTDWNSVLLDAVRSSATPPPKASRAMAMMHCAIYDAVNALEGFHYHPYLATTPELPQPHATSMTAAAAAAAHRVLVHLYPDQQAMLDAQLAASLEGIPRPLMERGVEWGIGCGDAIIAHRADDGATTVVDYVPLPGIGHWRPTAPGHAPAALPNWANLACWTMKHPAQFRGDGPPALNSAAYTVAFKQVKRLGGVDSTHRTAEQTEIALFWADGPGTATPPGHWNVIAQDIAGQHEMTVLESARLFAMLNCALADAAVCAWDNKYAFNHWRPYTGIHRAAKDGNLNTKEDKTWQPLIATPPFPAYSSGHSTFSAAGAAILARFFGADDISFTTTSDALPGVTRSFTSIKAAAEEAGKSRIYGGIHWQYDNQDGLEGGRKIGARVIRKFFKLIGDVDNDKDVDVDDLHLLLASFGACADEDDCPADLNGDGQVDSKDLTILVHNMH